jgi:enoyl-CoA hydratase
MVTLDTPAAASDGAPAPAYRSMRVERHGATGAVAEVVLTGPGKGNAFGPDFAREMPAVFASLDKDSAVRVVVIRGAGAHFSYGLDLQAAMGQAGFTVAGENLAAERTELYDHILYMQRSCAAVAECRKPVIAAIAGWCIGFGLDLASACDYRLCSAEARISLREARMGIVADMGSLQRLPYIVGEGRLREMAYSGKDIDAAEALRIGLVNQVYDTPEDLFAATRAQAEEIAANPPLVVQGVKRVLNAGRDQSIEEGLRFVAAWNSAFMQSHDLAEAMTAFMQRRAPEFKGK